MTLENAIKISYSWGEVFRNLGYKSTPSYVKEKVKKLGIDISHFKSQNYARVLPKEILEEVVKESHNWKEVCDKLGIKYQRNIKLRVKELGLDFSHFNSSSLRAKTNRKESPKKQIEKVNLEIQNIANECTGYQDLYDRLNEKIEGFKSSSNFREYVKSLNLNTDHFKKTTYTNEKFRKELESLYGEKIIPLEEYEGYNSPLKFKCIKHGDFIKTPHDVLQGHACTKCTESKGEKEIRKFLEENRINYKFQMRFNECKYKSCLPFDFYIPSKNVCIEYQGIQHYQPIDHFGGIKEFEELKKRDQIKKDFCKKNNISLIEITNFSEIKDKLSFLIKNN